MARSSGGAQLDALRFFRHGFDKLRVNFLFHQNAAACRAHFTLIDEHAEERAVHGGFPIRAIEENIWRFAAQLQGHTLQGVRGALDDQFADGRAAGERDLIHAGMRDQRGTAGLAKAIHDIDDAGRQAHVFEPACKFKRRQRSLLRGLEHARAARRERRRQLPCGHQQRKIPGNDLSRNADGLAQREAQRIGRHGIHVAHNFVRQAAVIFKAGGHIRDVEFGFHNGLAGVARFQFRKHGGVLSDFFRELE